MFAVIESSVASKNNILHNILAVGHIVPVISVACVLSQATSESATKRAALLSDMHLRNLHQKLQIKQRMDEITKKLEVSYYALSLRYLTFFLVKLVLIASSCHLGLFCILLSFVVHSYCTGHGILLNVKFLFRIFRNCIKNFICP